MLLSGNTIPKRSNDSATQEHTVVQQSAVAKSLLPFCLAIAAFGLTETLDLWIVEGSGEHNTAVEQRTGTNNLSIRSVTYRYSS